MKIPIVFSTDHNFVMPTCVTIHSLLSSADKTTTFDINIIADPDVTQEDKELIEKQVMTDSSETIISFVEIGDVFRGGYEIRGISKACYNRLMIPWLFPQYDKIIYSDVDIIFTGDISEVFETELGENYVAGVSGPIWKKGIIKKYVQKISADPKEYINSGFLVINSGNQRRQNLKEKYLEYSKSKFIYQDQDIINIVCKGKIQLLPGKYNIKPIDYYSYLSGEGKVIHYIGLKPWDHFTYCWIEWWESYKQSVVYKPELNKIVSGKILKSDYGFKVKRKSFKERYKFLKNYLRSYNSKND